MRRFRITAACVVGACVLAALAAGSASAALPELGRCVKVGTPKTGMFSRGNCIGIQKKHQGEYEWEAGPGAKKSFKENLTGPLFETTKGEQIGCTLVQMAGEYTGAKSDKITKLVGDGCENLTHHTACYSNPISTGVIESEVPLAGELGDIPGSRNEANPWVGWDLKGENSTLPMVSFFCGEAKSMITFMLEGSVIGRVTRTNFMESSFGITFKQTHGVQAPTSFIGGAEDVLELSEKAFGSTETTTSQTGLASPGSIAGEEPLEVKAKA